jgi:hypothetical protein
VPELPETDPEPPELEPDVPEAEPEPLAEPPELDPDAPEAEPEPVSPDCDPAAPPELDPDAEPAVPLPAELSVDEHAATATTAAVSNRGERALMTGILLLSGRQSLAAWLGRERAATQQALAILRRVYGTNGRRPFLPTRLSTELA